MTEPVNVIKQKLKSETAHEEKHLIFSLAGESYGISILKIIEIIGLTPITVVPKMPRYYKGVINLRGKVIPVVDLRVKFGLGNSEYNERSCIVIVKMEATNVSILVGLMVDSVSEVLNIPKSDIEPPPAFGQKFDDSFIKGISKSGGSIKILLDVDAVLSSNEAGILKNTVTGKNREEGYQYEEEVA